MSLLLSEPLSCKTTLIFINGNPARFDRENRTMLPPIELNPFNLIYCLLQRDEVPEAVRAAVKEYGAEAVSLKKYCVTFEPTS